MIAVYKGAGEQNMSAEIQCLLGWVAAFSHLVLHCVRFLHRGLGGVTGGRVTGHKIWKVSGKTKETTSMKVEPAKINKIKLLSAVSCFLMMAPDFNKEVSVSLSLQETMPFV